MLKLHIIYRNLQQMLTDIHLPLLNSLNGLVHLSFLKLPVINFGDINMSLVRLHGFTGWPGSILVANANHIQQLNTKSITKPFDNCSLLIVSGLDSFGTPTFIFVTISLTTMTCDPLLILFLDKMFVMGCSLISTPFLGHISVISPPYQLSWKSNQ